MQSEKEIQPIFASSEYTAEEELEAIEAFTMVCLVKKCIAIGKNKTKQELFKHWWTEYVLSIKAQKELVANCSTDGQEQTTDIKSEIDDKTSDDEISQIIESIETRSVDDSLQAKQHQEPHSSTAKIEKI